MLEYRIDNSIDSEFCSLLLHVLVSYVDENESASMFTRRYGIVVVVKRRSNDSWPGRNKRRHAFLKKYIQVP